MLWFRTEQTGDAVFGVTPTGAVLRLGAFTGSVMNAAGAFSLAPVGLISVAADVGEWLLTLPASP